MKTFILEPLYTPEKEAKQAEPISKQNNSIETPTLSQLM